MNFRYEIKNRVMIVKLGVEIDHHEAESIRKSLDQLISLNPIKVLIFDFSNTSFMDSSGIGIIMGRYNLMKSSGGQVGLINVNENIQKVLKLSGIYRLVNQYQDVKEAVRKLV